MAGESRRRKLTGAGAFDAVFRAGRRSEGEFLQLVAAPAAHECGRVGYVIAARTLPRAVDRNRVRRMLREVLRETEAMIAGFDVIVRIKRPVARSQFAGVVAEARHMLPRLSGNRG